MTTETPAAAVRSRDAVNTRKLLLTAARRRFAKEGYSATTVRDIANDAGVNVALINRYFASKEGLFEECLASASEDFKNPSSEPMTIDRVLVTILQHVADSPDGDISLMLLLLLRSSNDERAEAIRRTTFETFSRRLAIATGADPRSAAFADVMLRAQVVLSAVIGVVLLRSSTGVEPLTSATEDELGPPLADLLAALLPSLLH
jgi:AcrR family transcriptional regulator